MRLFTFTIKTLTYTDVPVRLAHHQSFEIIEKPKGH